MERFIQIYFGFCCLLPLFQILEFATDPWSPLYPTSFFALKSYNLAVVICYGFIFCKFAIQSTLIPAYAITMGLPITALAEEMVLELKIR
jgi:hypothetical protein